MKPHSSAQKYDAVIVGAGHNGLTCGAYLARAGKHVLVLERKPHIGGASVTEEFAPGYRASTYSFIMGHLHPRVIAELELRKHGLKSIPVPDVCNPTEDDCIVFSKDPKKTHAQIARFSRRDADNYPRFFEHLQSTVKLLREVQMLTPTNPFRRDPAGLFKTARLAWKLRNYEKEIYTLMQTLSLNAFDYVSRWFESDIVKAKFMFWATIGGNVGPYSPGTAFYLVAHLIGQTGLSFAKGGMGAIADAIAGAGKAHGMRIRGCGRDPGQRRPGPWRQAGRRRGNPGRHRGVQSEREGHLRHHQTGLPASRIHALDRWLSHARQELQAAVRD